MARRKLEKYLRKCGCLLKRNGSNHDVWISPIVGSTFPVPRHNHIGRGLALKIFKEAGINGSL